MHCTFLLLGVDQEGRQLGACSKVVQGRPQNHRVADPHRGYPGVPSRTLHAAIRGLNVPGHGPRATAGAIKLEWSQRRQLFFLGVVQFRLY